MGVKEKSPNSIYIVDDLLEDIFLRLSLKSILKSKSVSKRWRSILESEKFMERRMSLEKSRKILAAYNCNCGGQPRLLPESRFIGDEEIVYYALQRHTTLDDLRRFGLHARTRLNQRFEPLDQTTPSIQFWSWDSSPVYPTMGIGIDKVTGSYKVVKMEVGLPGHLVVECSVLMLSTPPPYKVHAGRKSVSVIRIRLTIKRKR